MASDLVVPRGLDLLRRPRFLILVDARKQLAGQLDALVGRESLRLFEYRMDVAAHGSQLIAVSAVARRPVSLAPTLGGLGSEMTEGSPPDRAARCHQITGGTIGSPRDAKHLIVQQALGFVSVRWISTPAASTISLDSSIGSQPAASAAADFAADSPISVKA